MSEIGLDLNTGSLGSLVRQVVDDLHLPDIEDAVRRKAISAMRFMRDRRYYFSEREITFTLTAGKDTYRPGDGYGLPRDLVEIVGKTIWIKISGSDDQRWPCNRVATKDFEWSRAGYGTTRSQPEAWDFRGNLLRFSPASQASDDVAELRYVTNIGIPRVTWEAGAYKFYHPVTNAVMTETDLDNFTNDWLSCEHGGEMIRARTMYDVQKTYLRDLEGANESLATWLELVQQLENETEAKQGGLTELPGCILGDGGDW